MLKFYFTFDAHHTHPKTRVLLKDYWVEINARSWDEARDMMIRHFGDDWSFQYSADIFNKEFYPKGCYQSFEVEEEDYL